MALHALRDLIREMPFLMRRPGTEDYLEGSIDLLFSWEGKTFFIDWKSNFQPDYQEATCAETVRADYSLQFAIYAIATCRFLGIDSEQAYEARFGGGLYVFLRGVPEGGQAGARPSWGELKNWEQALEAGREDEIHVRI
jgi:ATP-dependent exoDNAse (exonuclease V) beta subunit